MEPIVLRSGVILALGSLLGLFSSFIFSVCLEKDLYGELVTLFSLISIFVLAAPFGTNAYFLSHRETYAKYANAIIVFPAFISSLIGLFFLVDEFALLRMAFLALLVVSTLSVQGIMAGQIKQNGAQAAIFQSLQPFLKSVAALAVLASLAGGGGEEATEEILAVSLILGSLLAIPLVLWRLIDLRTGGGLLDLTFFKRLTKAQWINLISFWLSSILGMTYSLGIIPLVYYFHGHSHAAYLGIYFIFWSGSNIFTTMLINNHYWPKFCAARAAGEREQSIMVDSLLASLGVAALTLFGTIFVAVFISSLVWREYSDIENFLIIASLAICIRAVSAWFGMMILSFDGLIARKMRAQLVMVLLMALSVAALDISSHQALAWLLVTLEAGYFIGYLLSSLHTLKNKLLGIC